MHLASGKRKDREAIQDIPGQSRKRDAVKRGKDYRGGQTSF